MEALETDLFGDPYRLPNGRRGRPKHVSTQENRNKVMMLTAMGWSNERIANAIFCSVPTLKRYYFSELKARAIQRDRLKARQLMQAFAKAEEGVVGAMRFFEQLVEKNDLMELAGGFEGKGKHKPKREPEKPKGKKDQAHQAAKDATTGEFDTTWGDDLTPGKYQ